MDEVMAFPVGEATVTGFPAGELRHIKSARRCTTAIRLTCIKAMQQ
jgi:hypothetical protein